MNIFKKIPICQDIQQLIEYHYWRDEFNNVLKTIKKIKYSTSDHRSTLPTRPIIVQCSIIYVPDLKKLFRVIASYNVDNTRCAKDINICTTCRECDYYTTSKVVDITMNNGEFTVPIFRWGKNNCRTCLNHMPRLPVPNLYS
jgi:hypothetical protein